MCRKTDIEEDAPLRPNVFSALLSILFQCVTTLIVSSPITNLSTILYCWFDHLGSSTYSIAMEQVVYVFHCSGIPFTNRILIFIIVFDNLVKSLIKAVGWYLDEIFYPAYHKCEIKEPLFLLSAIRSGSTQLADYLENDEENFLTPMFVEAKLPYIWAWKIIAPILKQFGLKKYFEVPLPFYGKEMQKRHNSNCFKTDTWEMAVGVEHMLLLTYNLGISFMKWGSVASALKEQPVDREFCKIFLEYSDCVMKKVMYHRGLPKQRIFIKTHLLIVASELERRYDGAKFLAVVRDPVKRFQSVVNFVKVVSSDGPMRRYLNVFPMTWRVARDWVIESQIYYCEDEMTFYKQSEENGKNKCAISFDTYVKDLAGTLQCVYSFLNIPMSPKLLSKAAALQKSLHDRTDRKIAYDSKFNRSLSTLGIDEEKLKEHLSDYINWMKRLDA